MKFCIRIENVILRRFCSWQFFDLTHIKCITGPLTPTPRPLPPASPPPPPAVARAALARR